MKLATTATAPAAKRGHSSAPKVTKKATLAFVREKLGSDTRWATRALHLVFQAQTAQEQASATTHDDNGVGFSGVDAEFLTSLANQINGGRTLSYKQNTWLLRKMPKYAGQVIARSDAQKLAAQVLAHLNGTAPAAPAAPSAPAYGCAVQWDAKELLKGESVQSSYYDSSFYSVPFTGSYSHSDIYEQLSPRYRSTGNVFGGYSTLGTITQLDDTHARVEVVYHIGE
jgi:hypothetical protein